MQTAMFTQGDHPFGPPAHFLGLGHRRVNAFVIEKRGNHIPEHGEAMARGPVQFSARNSVAHGLFLFLSSLFDFIAAGKVIDLHSQRESHFAEDLFYLVERLAAEILGLEHLLLGFFEPAPRYDGYRHS